MQLQNRGFDAPRGHLLRAERSMKLLELERAQNFRARALGHSTGSGSGFRKQGSRAQISLAYYLKIQLFVTFKFRALSGLVEN